MNEKIMNTIKLLVIGPSVYIEGLTNSIKDLPIILVLDSSVEKAYIVDTGIEVKIDGVRIK